MLISVDSEGYVDRSGVHTPTGTKIVKLNYNSLVVKVPAHTVWGGVNVGRIYANAEYEVYSIREIRETPLGAEYIVDRVVDFPVSSKRQQEEVESFYKYNPHLR